MTSWYGALMKGVFNFSPQMSVAEVVIYFVYLVPTMTLFLLPVRDRTVAAPQAGTTSATGGREDRMETTPTPTPTVGS